MIESKATSFRDVRGGSRSVRRRLADALQKAELSPEQQATMMPSLIGLFKDNLNLSGTAQRLRGEVAESQRRRPEPIKLDLKAQDAFRRPYDGR
jgi:hypothetical protein